MCGIVGFVGRGDAKDFLIKGLLTLEYRGYDSAGVAVVKEKGDLEVICRKGKVAELSRAVKELNVTGSCGIGHTRWATHGEPSEANAHPHIDCTGNIAVVHNGIIENFMELKEELLSRGHVFASETDTEVIAHLIEESYEGDLVQALRAATSRLIGAYGLAVVHSDCPDEIAVTRKESPIVVGNSVKGAFVGSDPIALIDYTRDVVYLEDDCIALLHGDGKIDYYGPDGEPYYPEPTHIDWDAETASRTGFPDFMLKEIYEQPRVISDTIAGRFDGGAMSFPELDELDSWLDAVSSITIVGCGTSYHAGLIAREFLERWARIPVSVEVASEFRYRSPILDGNSLVIAITQSGETADTLEAIKIARSLGAKTITLTNVIGSRAARESDAFLNIRANIEISVAATKSFLAQVALLACLAMHLGVKRGKLGVEDIARFAAEIAAVPAQITQILNERPEILRCAKACSKAHSVMFIGRGFGYVSCKEGALKLKEISYLHAEAYPAGEIKHGPIALIDESVPVVVIATKSDTYEKVVSNIIEVRTRGAKIVAIATEGDESIKKLTDYVIYVPEIPDCFSPLTTSVALQLFAREIALIRGCDVDQPRNLAKSVTVE